MKKAILWLLAMTAFIGCSKDDGAVVPDGGFKVGDMYVSKSRQGVVVRVNPDLKSGLIISPEDTYCNWDEAVVWTRTLGKGWRMPTEGELRDLYNVKADVDGVLLQHGMSLLDVKICWASSFDDQSAWTFSMGNGVQMADLKEDRHYARAVAEF